MTSVTHTLVCGASRSGKSEAELARLVPLAIANNCAIVLLDPPGTLAEKFLLHLDQHGLTARVIYDRLSETDHVPVYEWLSPSKHSDPLQRQAQNDERIREFAAILLRRRGIQDMAATPLIEEGILAALRLYTYQRTPVPFEWLADAFVPGTDARVRLLANCTEPELLRKFDVYARLSPTARRTETGPAERVLRAVCESPAFRLRSGRATFDLDRFLDRHGILILDGSSRGNLSRDAAAIMMGTVLLRCIDHCRTGSQSRVVLVLDEAVNASLIGVHESRALAEAGKWGLEFHVIVQDPFSFPSEEIRNNVLQNCWRHEWFRQGSPAAARLAAEDIATPALDPLKVHHTEYRIRTVVEGYQRVETKSHSERKDERGSKLGKSTNRATVLWPRRKEVKDAQDRYTTLGDQVSLVQKELMSLTVGYRFVRTDDVTPVAEYVPMLNNRQVDGDFSKGRSDYSEIRFRAILQSLWRRSAYRSTPAIAPHGLRVPSLMGAARRLQEMIHGTSQQIGKTT